MSFGNLGAIVDRGTSTVQDGNREAELLSAPVAFVGR